MSNARNSNTAIFYVYIIFRDNGLPCYIGKGTGERWQTLYRGSHHNKRLTRALRKSSEEFPIVIVRNGMIERDAFALEELLIHIIGRADQGRGPLFNLTDGGEGTAGHTQSKKTREKISTRTKEQMLLSGASDKIRASYIANEGPEKRSVRMKEWHASLSIEEREARSAKHSAALKKTFSEENPNDKARRGEKLSAAGLKWNASMSPEQKAEHNAKVSAGRKAAYEALTLEEKEARRAKYSADAKARKALFSPEKRKEIAAKISATKLAARANRELVH